MSPCNSVRGLYMSPKIISSQASKMKVRFIWLKIGEYLIYLTHNTWHSPTNSFIKIKPLKRCWNIHIQYVCFVQFDSASTLLQTSVPLRHGYVSSKQGMGHFVPEFQKVAAVPTISERLSVSSNRFTCNYLTNTSYTCTCNNWWFD